MFELARSVCPSRASKSSHPSFMPVSSSVGNGFHGFWGCLLSLLPSSRNILKLSWISDLFWIFVASPEHFPHCSSDSEIRIPPNPYAQRLTLLSTAFGRVCVPSFGNASRAKHSDNVRTDTRPDRDLTSIPSKTLNPKP